MLIDDPLISSFSRDPIMMAIASVNGHRRDTARLRKGVYEVGHFGSSDFLRGLYEQYPTLTPDGEPYIGCYGVCDGVDNLLRCIPMLEADQEREFVVTLTKVTRDLSNKGQGGGWRWHKWGAYIGDQTPTTEYLDDEPIIESIYVYHVYERIIGA
jgi:hypothetical protein